MIRATSDEDPGKIARVRDLLKNLQVSKKPLPADYVIAGNGKLVAIEIKWSIGDLLSSLGQVGEHGGPRLAVQARRMLQFADIAVLLIPQLRDRGDGRVLLAKDRASGWDYLSVKGILSDLALYGIIVDEWDGDLARRLAQWYYALTSEGHSWIRQLGRPDFVTVDPLYREAIWCLCSFRGVGPKTAEGLLRDLGSVRAVAEAEPGRLQTTPGVGPKTAKALHEGMNQRW